MNNKILSYTRFLAGLGYIAIGFYMMSQPERGFLEPMHMKLLSGLIIFYGGFRLYRAYRMFTQEKQ